MLREHEWISKESYPAVYRSLLPAGGREASGRQPESEGKGQSQPQRPASSTKLWASSLLLTTSSWHPRWLTSARKVSTWDQLLRADTQHTWDSALAVPQGNRPPGLGRWLRQLTWDSALTKHLVAWAAQTWEAHEMHAQPSLCPCGALQNLNLSSLDLGSAGNPGTALDSSSSEQPGAWAVQTQKAKVPVSGGRPSVVQTLQALPTHASVICLQCSSLPTAQLNKWA